MNRAHAGAWRKGRQAAKDGLPIEACPYRDKRQDSGMLTWSRSFIAAWEDGYNDRGPRPE